MDAPHHDTVRFLEGYLPIVGRLCLTAIVPDKPNKNAVNKAFKATDTSTFEDATAAAEWVARQNQTKNIYFHANSVSGKLTKKAGKGDIANCVVAHVDLDPEKGADLEAERKCLLARIEGFDPAPSIVIDSGGGYQAFWVFDEPVPASLGGDVEELNRAFGGDNTHDISRLMRVPGTTNWPNKTKRDAGRKPTTAALVKFEPELRHPFETLRSAFVAAPDQNDGQSHAERPEGPAGSISAMTRSLLHLTDAGAYPSRSELLIAFVGRCLREGVDDVTIVGLMTDEAYRGNAIFEHVAENGGAAYATRQIERARSKAKGQPSGPAMRAATPPIHWARLPEMERPPYLVKGVLTAGSMSVIYGPSGSMKTFFALTLSLQVARGEPLGSHQVKQTPVVYIACEGGLSIEDRLAAYAQFHHLDRDGVPFYVLPQTINLRDPKADPDGLISEIKKINPGVGLIVIDTLSRALAGGNENSPDDMGAFVMCCDRLREETGAHVAVIHHTGKDKDRGARGHSLLKAASDTELMVEKVSAFCTVRTTRQRDMAEDFADTFQAQRVELGTDEDGDEISSVVLIPTDMRPSPETKLPDQPRKALEILRGAITTEGVWCKDVECGLPPHLQAVRLSTWRDRCLKARLSDKSADANRKAFDRARDKLLEEDLIGADGDWAWIWPRAEAA